MFCNIHWSRAYSGEEISDVNEDDGVVMVAALTQEKVGTWRNVEFGNPPVRPVEGGEAREGGG